MALCGMRVSMQSDMDMSNDVCIYCRSGYSAGQDSMLRCNAELARGPMTASNVRKLVTRAGESAGLPFPVHHHMLRHACGYKLANDGQDTRALQQYLGHRNIQHTVRYTELSPDRFKTFWKD